MMAHSTALMKSLLLGTALIAVLVLSPAVARADVLKFHGHTAGCFNCGPAGPFSYATSFQGLTYNNSSFNVTTNAAGDASLNANAVLPPGFNFNNLGSFTLGTQPALYNGATFTLFFSPTGPPGTDNLTFTAPLTGLVQQDAQGNLIIDFDNDFQTFSFSGPGTYRFRVNDVILTPGGTMALTGDIAGAAIPEPATLLLLGTGLVGAAGARRRRVNGRKNA